MRYQTYIPEPATLLEDLLEDSARVFHRHCAIIQRVFHEALASTRRRHGRHAQLNTRTPIPSWLRRLLNTGCGIADWSFVRNKGS